MATGKRSPSENNLQENNLRKWRRMKRRKNDDDSDSVRVKETQSTNEVEPCKVDRKSGNEEPPSNGNIWIIFVCGTMAVLLLMLLWAVRHRKEPFISFVVEERDIYLGYGKARDSSVPEYLMDIFSVHDVNLDGHLDPEEFRLLARHIPNRKQFFESWSVPEEKELREPLFEPFIFKDEHRKEEDEVVRVKAEIEPLLKSTMMCVRDSKAIWGNVESLLPGLSAWTAAAEPLATYGVGNFEAFAPPSQWDGWAVGAPYSVVGNRSNPAVLLPMLQMAPHRYHPPPPQGKEVLLHALLAQFHPNVFLGMRSEPRGTLAVLRALNERYYDIVFRSHVEYQINSRPDLPFWFTPAQFSGRLVVSRDFRHLQHFRMWVPTTKQLNIDMEWLTEPNGQTNRVDIGFIPKMELSSDGPSKRESAARAAQQGGKEQEWSQEISVEEAESIIEREFFPFKQVPYLSLPDAFDLAAEQNKPVHHILLWGALDDQSC